MALGVSCYCGLRIGELAGNRRVTEWSDVCVNCTTENQFKNCLKCQLQPETKS